MADVICVLLSTDSELLELKAAFEEKFKDFTKVLGDDCAIFSSISNLLKDASNVAGEWEKELKGAMKAVSDKASELFNALKDMLSISSAGLDALKNFLNDLNSAFDTIKEEVGKMMDAISEAVNGIKMAMCDVIAEGIKAIPPEIVAVSAAAAMIKNYDFVKDIKTGKNIVGTLDTDAISTNILNNLGVKEMKNKITDKVNSVKNFNINELLAYKC